MFKKSFKAMIANILSLVMFLTMAYSSVANAFTEDFERYTIGERPIIAEDTTPIWNNTAGLAVNGSTSGHLNTDSAFIKVVGQDNGNKALALRSTTTGNTLYRSIATMDSSFQNDVAIMEYRVMVPDNNNRAMVYIVDKNGGIGSIQYKFTEFKSGNIFSNGVQVAGVSYTPFVWYDVAVKINKSTKVADIYMRGEDGSSAIWQQTFPSSLTTGIVCNLLTTGGSTTTNKRIIGDIMVDDIKVYPTSEALDYTVSATESKNRLKINFNYPVNFADVSTADITLSSGILVESLKFISNKCVEVTTNVDIAYDTDYTIALTSDFKTLEGTLNSNTTGITFNFATPVYPPNSTQMIAPTSRYFEENNMIKGQHFIVNNQPYSYKVIAAAYYHGILKDLKVLDKNEFPEQSPTYSATFATLTDGWGNYQYTPSTNTTVPTEPAPAPVIVQIPKNGSLVSAVTFDTASNNRQTIKKTFDTPQNGIVDIWFFDDSAQLDTAFAVTVQPGDGTSIDLGLGVMYQSSKTNYAARIGAAWTATNVKRSTGWHKFTYDYTSKTGVKLYVDDVFAAESSNYTEFTTIGFVSSWLKTCRAAFSSVTIRDDKKETSFEIPVGDIVADYSFKTFAIADLDSLQNLSRYAGSISLIPAPSN